MHKLSRNVQQRSDGCLPSTSDSQSDSLVIPVMGLRFIEWHGPSTEPPRQLSTPPQCGLMSRCRLPVCPRPSITLPARTDVEPRAPTRPAILWNVLVALLHAVLHTILVAPHELFWQCHLSSTNGSRSNGNTPLSLDTSDCNRLIKSCDRTFHLHVLFLASSSTDLHGARCL